MNTTDTTMGAVPGTTPGAGALALAPEGLTITDQHVEVALKRANGVGRALDFMNKRMKSSKTTGETWDHYWEAGIALCQSWNKHVDHLAYCGGLLHLGRVF